MGEIVYQQGKIRKGLKSINFDFHRINWVKTNYTTMMQGDFKFKFFSREKYVIKNIRDWNWPFLDIFLYQEVGNGTESVITNPIERPIKFQQGLI